MDMHGEEDQARRESFMRQAISLSYRAMREMKGGPFGAVVVRDGKILGKGFNQVTSTNDPTAHAEIVAIRDACRNANSFSLERCEIYSSCEPCPMCLGAILWARIGSLYYANSRFDAANIGFDDNLFREHARGNAVLIEPVRMLGEEAIKAFQEWARIDGKQAY